jgi:hypothetical protein
VAISLRKKVYMAIGIILINCLGLIALAFQHNQTQVLLSITVVTATVVYMLSLRCPNCNVAVLWKRIRILGVTGLSRIVRLTPR